MHAKTFASIHAWFPLHTHSTGKGNKTTGKIHDEEKRGLNWHQQVTEVAGSSRLKWWLAAVARGLGQEDTSKIK
jgi:hypothetical protein